MYEKIIVAVDGSAHSGRAAKHGATIAKATGASVDLLYVVDYDRSRPQEFEHVTKEELDSYIRDQLSEIFTVFSDMGIRPELQIQFGEPGPAIVKFINSAGYDLAIVGSRGLNAFQEMVLGSVSHKVAKRAECPVLLVK
ncbi:universal stress protein [Bhargavaea beijingensis]|uniref:Universal stress protein n=1 Tax=Bhargavaea beijingensis TaxID=426756 RepID=A0A1G7FA45_9BACL|nr:universal stress protein [Bhargavaea beijingensis]MCW1927705.1 universal stress protein [Bhargavaea beijingensis]RSK33362.1 universal stress protein [Bhargavaea beijingensis]SDE72813.1 Nucleotide-binding universal stress protein, UspA family [Bhargavaea beijingensis]